MRKNLRIHASLALAATVAAAFALAACGDQGGPQPGATATSKPIGAAPAGTGAGSAKPAAAAKADIDPDRLALFKPLPDVMESPDNKVTDDKVTLGRMLYFEKRISKNHDVSCNSCHDLAKYGVDGKDVSEGHKGQKGTRNSPTVYNAALHAMQFWDGRAKDVEEQAGMPVLNPVEMAMKDEAAVLETLKSMPEYEEAFKKAFPDDKDAVTYANFKKAIGAFERKLVTPSKWDKFLKGDKAALTDEEKKGFNAFWDAGCQTCHNGPGVGGSLMQKAGSVKEWPNQKDQGKYEVSKADSDKMLFKAQGLRNIEKTAPYFHDASAKTLEDATKMMAEHQLGKKLTDDEVKLIVTWMKTLTGELPAEYIKEPTLPKSTAKTPKPDAG